MDVSVDGGASWAPATLGREAGPAAWRAWTFTWMADDPGRHVLCCRARDAAGNVQPVEPSWNLGGYANNAVQRVTAVVT